MIVREWTAGADHFLATALVWFGHGKLYGVFAFLFGLSAVWLRGRGRAAWARRMLVLAVIGAAHRLIWEGDILLTYAVLGLGLLLVWNWKPSRLPGLAVGLALVPVAIYGLYAWGAAIGAVTLSDGGGGGLLNSVLFWWTQVAAMMLLGVWAGRTKALVWAAPLFVGLGLLIGLPLAGFDAITGRFADPVVMLAGRGLGLVGGLALGLGYVGAGVLFWRFVPFQRGWAAIGRLALTNYLFQTVIMLVLFNGLGLAFTPTQSIVVWLIVITAQGFSSHICLLQFGYGPVELLWRLASGGGMVTAPGAAGV